MHHSEGEGLCVLPVFMKGLIMNILIITTGGTIDSVCDGDSIDVSEAQSGAVVRLYQKEYDDAAFDVTAPLNILSERLSAGDLNTLVGAILSADTATYDGVIFTCGSDNLGYIASFIGLLTCRWELPVAVVASDKVLGAPNANGYANFRAAIELIRSGGKGCFVPYRNTDGTMYIHSATDIRQADLSDDFFSFHGAYAVMKNDVLILNRNYIKQAIPEVFDRDHLPRIKDNIALIHPYPLLDYDMIDFTGKRAMLHTLYHSATLDSQGVIRLMDRLGDIPLYLASFRSGRSRYRTAAETIEAGAIPLTDISPECAYMKLLLAAAQDSLPIREFMEE